MPGQPSPASTTAALATGHDTLDAIQATLHQHAHRAGHLIAAFMAAAVAAANGRDILLAAPSLPHSGASTAPGHGDLAAADPAVIAVTLAQDAGTLSGTLTTAAAAAPPADKAPLAAAAAWAAEVHACLTGTG
jgi:hypothetical protein